MLNFNRKNNATSDDIIDDEERNDFFSGPDIPDEPKKPKQPVLHPEDPEYWLREESQWEHLQPRSRFPMWFYIVAVVIVIAGGLAIWLRYFKPYIDEAQQFGYVDSVQHRGILFKTYEGNLLPYRSLMDTTRVYSRDFIFSVTNDTIGRALMTYSRTGKPICVKYRQYHSSMPWRGETKILIYDVDTVEAELLVPPDLRPDTRTNAGIQ